MTKLNSTGLTAGFELVSMCPKSNEHLTRAAYNLALIEMGVDPYPVRTKELPSIHKSVAILAWFLVWGSLALLAAKAIRLFKITRDKWLRSSKRER